MLHFGLRRTFSRGFVTDIHNSVLGTEFLFNFDRLVDTPNRRLVDRITNVSVNVDSVDFVSFSNAL